MPVAGSEAGAEELSGKISTPGPGLAMALRGQSGRARSLSIHGAPTKARGFHRGPREAKSCRDYDFSRASISCLVRSRISRILAILAESWLARVAAFNAVFMRSAAGRITSAPSKPIHGAQSPA